MYRDILIATDGSDLARHAVDQGLALAKAVGASVTIVIVTESITRATAILMPRPEDVMRYEAAAGSAAHKVLEQVAASARASGIDCRTVHVKDRAPADGILEVCRSHGCDLIAMATHGRRGMDRFLLGSQSQEVMALSPVPVLVCR